MSTFNPWSISPVPKTTDYSQSCKYIELINELHEIENYASVYFPPNNIIQPSLIGKWLENMSKREERSKDETKKTVF